MRYLITFAYDGSKFSGYQKQKDLRTVQGELEKALKIINKKDVLVSASGRTDAGVHALNQKAHFDLSIKITPDKLQLALNSLLPPDIYVKNVIVVDKNFHARYNVLMKEYIYIINMGEYNPIQKDYIYQYCKPLDINKMDDAIKQFIGEHNFKSFACAQDERDNYNRTIIQAYIMKDVAKDQIVISFLGTGFLRYMVRNMVGLLLEIGQGKKNSEDVLKIISAEDRKMAGITAPPQGLYLKDVQYKLSKSDK